jgi:hypothetical protein
MDVTIIGIGITKQENAAMSPSSRAALTTISASSILRQRPD